MNTEMPDTTEIAAPAPSATRYKPACDVDHSRCAVVNLSSPPKCGAGAHRRLPANDSHRLSARR
jgi:hypothetical protein